MSKEITQTVIIDAFEYTRMNVRLEITHNEEIDKWIAENHYLKSAPAVSIIRMAFKDKNGRLVGAMLWNHPTAREMNQQKILELTRMYFVDDTPHCIESHCLSMARKYIRKRYPHIKGLIAYSSTAYHDGIVYEADGWFVIQRTKSKSWAHRRGRVDRDLSDKIKWARSP